MVSVLETIDDIMDDLEHIYKRAPPLVRAHINEAQRYLYKARRCIMEQICYANQLVAARRYLALAGEYLCTNTP